MNSILLLSLLIASPKERRRTSVQSQALCKGLRKYVRKVNQKIRNKFWRLWTERWEELKKLVAAAAFLVINNKFIM